MAKLPNAPLQEVVFELRWELQVDTLNSREFDENFEFAVGRFQQLVANAFPVYRRKAISTDSVPYQVTHQFWSSDRTWPVLQLGPGILTINETDVNYDWESTFSPLVRSAVEWLRQAYGGRQKFILASLRYIDAVSIANTSTGDAAEFIHRSLKINILNEFETPGVLNYVNLNQFFDLEDGSQLELVVSTGRDEQRNPALIWQTAVSKRAVFDANAIFDWLEQAHIRLSSLFITQTSGRLYDSFK